MRILITGGTGSLGQALIARWRDKHELRILSRNPHKQQMVQEKFGLEPSAFVLADICDYEAVRRACLGQDVLIHAAALKTVSQGEQAPDEYLRVNSLGSQVVARAWKAARWKGDPDSDYSAATEPRKALYINSDKAVAPINFYGCSKRIGEAFFINHGFSSIRYGNVVESEGSFIHKWKKARAAGRPIKVRIPDPTRFFLSMTHGVDLIESALMLMSDSAAGEAVATAGASEFRETNMAMNGIFVPHMEAFSLADVARAMTPEVNICYEMLRPGEKQHEILLQEGEKAERVNDLLAVVTAGRMKKMSPEYSSETTERLDPAEVLRRLNVSPLQEVFS